MRELSSRWTIFYKFVFPTLWIGGFASGTLVMFVLPDASMGEPDPDHIRWIFLAVTLAGTAFIYWACIRLKRVALSDTTIIVSNYRVETAIPLSEVEQVSGSLFINPELVWLRFRRGTRFGTKIVFMPKVRLRLRRLPGFTRHPMVRELQELVAKAH